MTNDEKLEALKDLYDFRYDPVYGNGHDQTIRTRAIRIMISGLDLPGTKETDKFLNWCIQEVKDRIAVQKSPQADTFLWKPAYGAEGD